MLAQEMVDRSVSVRQVATQLGVDESTLPPHPTRGQAHRLELELLREPAPRPRGLTP